MEIDELIMVSATQLIKDEENPAKIGLIVSVVIIIASLFPKIESSWITFTNPYAFETFLIGISMLFFFMAIKVNMRVRIEKDGNNEHIFDVLPSNYTGLSIGCFFISGSIIFILLAIWIIKIL